MNGLKCPNCELVNLIDAQQCHRCGNSLEDLPQTAQVSVPVDQTFRAQAYQPNISSDIPQNNDTGRKTFFWYRVYLTVLLVIYLLLTGFGIVLALFAPETPSQSSGENLIVGILYAIFGAIFAIAFAVALFLPRKPYNWIVGIVYIALGMTSCCFLPATIPLLIFWLKPETKAYFGRS